MTQPKVYNKRDKNIPPDAVYVGRPSKWGNPFKIGGTYKLGNGNTLVTNATREQVINLYKAWLPTQHLNPVELRGKDLMCWCAPLPCHADILLELANKGA